MINKIIEWELMARPPKGFKVHEERGYGDATRLRVFIKCPTSKNKHIWRYVRYNDWGPYIEAYEAQYQFTPEIREWIELIV